MLGVKSLQAIENSAGYEYFLVYILCLLFTSFYRICWYGEWLTEIFYYYLYPITQVTH